ncbi:hypothetical protein ACFSM7_06275 [Clavibacter michiganensis subsp. tessellarius]|uniref:hypothetical protein n=1 Tax=Clavibacter tessellarius TaxID=31965 RepID=UPI00362F63C3
MRRRPLHAHGIRTVGTPRLVPRAIPAPPDPERRRMTSDRSLAFILLRSCLVMVALGVVTVQTGGGLGVVGVVAFVLAAGLGGGATFYWRRHLAAKRRDPFS